MGSQLADVVGEGHHLRGKVQRHGHALPQKKETINGV
jgi:hypothetical protein